MNTLSLYKFPVIMVASITFFQILLMNSLVPLHSFVGSKFRIRITVDPTFNLYRYINM